MEITQSDELYGNPLHPYTKALLSAIPIPDPKLKRERIILKGDVASPIDLPEGCRFNARCPEAFDLCYQKEPELLECSKGHYVACHKIRRDAH